MSRELNRDWTARAAIIKDNASGEPRKSVSLVRAAFQTSGNQNASDKSQQK